jgi:DNA-binding NarL/FixJ family response regulator
LSSTFGTDEWGILEMEVAMLSVQNNINGRPRDGRGTYGTTNQRNGDVVGARIQHTLRNTAIQNNAVQDKERARASHGSGRSKSAPKLLEQSSSGMEPMTGRPLTILIADDHPMVREGLAAVINRQSEMRVVAEAGNGREAVEQFVALRPDVALLDLRMPMMDGIEAVMSIYEREPAARMVIVTSYDSEEDIYRALRAGAQGYVLKDAPSKDLIDCIHAVGDGKSWIPPAVGAKLARRVTERSLTARETEVLRALAKGKSNKEIGVALNISEGTVKVHVTHMLEKLKVTGRTEAIGEAVKRGLVTMD